MAIFGAGSNWGGDEQKDDFIKNNYYSLGWSYDDAKDLYNVLTLLKAGDIIYLKANRSGSRTLRVKAIGIVERAFVHHLASLRPRRIRQSTYNGSHIPVKWIITDEFRIMIPEEEGRLTNIRAATLYEEHLPFVQLEILQKLFNYRSEIKKSMDYEIGQFITGVISTGLQMLQMWRETRNVNGVKDKVSQFDEITKSAEIRNEGRLLEQLIPAPVLATLGDRIDICWTDFRDAVANPNITPNQLDRYTLGLTECVCRELGTIKKLNGNLPTDKMQRWWNEYKCDHQ